MVWVLAFDIETSGATKECSVIAIGASVVDENLQEIDSFLRVGYIPGVTQFEQKCWDEFWCLAGKETLPKLQTVLPGNPEESQETRYKELQRNMINDFHQFRVKMENLAKTSGQTLELCSDNNVFDGGLINKMYLEYTDFLPIPYNTSGEYSPFFETFSQQRGLLFSIDPSFESNWGLTARIAELFDLPEIEREHDHLPNNDAYTIACEQQILHGIRSGKYQRK